MIRTWVILLGLIVAPGVAGAVPTIQITRGGVSSLGPYVYDAAWGIAGRGFEAEGYSISVGSPFDYPANGGIPLYSYHATVNGVESGWTDCLYLVCHDYPSLYFIHDNPCATGACAGREPFEVSVPFVMPLQEFIWVDPQHGHADPRFTVNLYGRGTLTVGQRSFYDDGNLDLFYSYVFAPVPEPATAGLLLMGVAGLIAWRRRS